MGEREDISIRCPVCRSELEVPVAAEKGSGVAWSGCEPTSFSYITIRKDGRVKVVGRKKWTKPSLSTGKK